MTLGCGAWEAVVTKRGGTPRVGALQWQQITMGRVLDEISNAGVSVGIGGFEDDECCYVLRNLGAYEHELALVRDGADVWNGPVMEPTFRRDQASVPARDLMHWFERRVLEYDRTFTDTETADIFLQFATDALSRDPSPNIQIIPAATGITGTRQVLASEVRRAADEMRELSRTSLDFTAIGRTIRVGGKVIPGTSTLSLSTEDFIDPELKPLGLQAASEWFVIGANSGQSGVPILGRYGEIREDIGLVQQVAHESSILDQTSADAAAQTRHAASFDVPNSLSGKLRAEAPIDFADLVPGTLFDIRCEVGCRTIEEEMRLARVDVTVSASDEGISETITVEFIPIGTTEAA